MQVQGKTQLELHFILMVPFRHSVDYMSATIQNMKQGRKKKG